MDYKRAYYALFSAVSDAIEVLQRAQRRMEELYMAEGYEEEGGRDAALRESGGKNTGNA